MAGERRTAVLIAPRRVYTPQVLMTMTRDDVFELCAALPGEVEDYPSGESVVVFKAGSRMFVLVPLGGSRAS